MACALPVVTTDVAGIPDLVNHGVNGLVCPPHDSAAVSEALLLLVTDHELRSRLGAEARRTVERGFDLAVNTRQLAMLLIGRS
jgi:glycosyltransferase involved in cell wall biosynthesis